MDRSFKRHAFKRHWSDKWHYVDLPTSPPRPHGPLVRGFVWPTGRHELGRICVQVVSDRGVFRGSRLAAPEELAPSDARQLFEQAARVAALLHDARYWGPFGIDGYRYHLGDARGFCALSEINARYTMAFAIGFPRATAELSLS